MSKIDPYFLSNTLIFILNNLLQRMEIKYHCNHICIIVLFVINGIILLNFPLFHLFTVYYIF